MTQMTKAPHDEAQRMKWQHQARKIAAELKGIPSFGDKEVIKAGVVFDDQVTTMEIPVELIHRLNEAALAEVIFNGVLELQKESAAPQAPGRNPETPTAPQSAHETGAGQPAEAAVDVCSRRIGEKFDTDCPNAPTGGLRVVLKPAEAVEKRWGRRSLMTFVMDLPLCAACFKSTSIMDCTDQELRSSMGKVAQRLNEGILVDWKRTQLEHVPFDDPQYVVLRQARAAKELQPGPAGPQQGAGDGKS